MDQNQKQALERPGIAGISFYVNSSRFFQSQYISLFFCIKKSHFSFKLAQEAGEGLEGSKNSAPRAHQLPVYLFMALVWCGMVWYGVVRYGMVCGMV